METENATINGPKQAPWAFASFVLSIVGWILFILIFLFYLYPSVFFAALFCWIISLVSGVVALVEIRTKRHAFKDKGQAIIGICASAIPLIVTGVISFLFYLALRGEPYDESHPEAVISIIEENGDIEFPAKMESLKAADGITPGVHPQYMRFIIKFTTDQEGVAQLRDSLRKQGIYPETPDYNSNDYDPVYLSTYKDTPQWFKIDIAKGVIYDSFGNTRKNAIKLHTICVPSENPDKIVVYMEGFGDLSLRKDKN